MAEQDELNSNSNTNKYFLIISVSVFIFNFINRYSFGMYFGNYWHFSITENITNSFNLLTSLPILGNLYFEYVTSTVYSFFGYYITLLFNLILGLGLNYMIARTLTQNTSNEVDESTTALLTVGGIVKNSFTITQNNAGIILTASLLWLLTIWIPYLNVGTTIGMWALVASLSKENSTFSAISIFKSKYRKYIGEVFLLIGFIMLGTSIGYMFFIIPGIIISFAWSQAIFILIDKECTPLQAIKLSNDITYGEKITIFLGYITLILILAITLGLSLLLLTLSGIYELVIIFSCLAYILSIIVMVSCTIYIYGELSSKLSTEQ